MHTITYSLIYKGIKQTGSNSLLHTEGILQFYCFPDIIRTSGEEQFKMSLLKNKTEKPLTRMKTSN